MRYALLPQTTLSASVIGLGTHPFGSDLEEAKAFRLLDAYIEHGGNFWDTADSPRMKDIYTNAENNRRFVRLQKTADALTLPLSVVSLAYLSSQPVPTFPLISSIHVEHLIESLIAGDLVLGPEMLQFVELG